MSRLNFRSQRFVGRHILFLAGFGALAACGDDDPSSPDLDSTNDMSSTDSMGTNPPVPTFWQDVAPIYFENCVACHQAGGVAPFRLDNYEDAAAFAFPSVHAVQARTMPPWLVRDDGSCGTYQHSRALTNAEIDTIVAWEAGGAPAGETQALETPELPHLNTNAEVQTPVFTPEAQGGELAKFDEYRCFLVDNPSPDRRRYLDGYEVIPGNPAMIHHALLMIVPGDLETSSGKTNAEVLAELDAESPDREGWPCFGLAGPGVENEDVPVVWAPGQGPVEYTSGVGTILDPTDKVVVQVHYNIATPDLIGQSDSTKVRIRLVESIERQSFNLLWDELLDTLGSDMPHIIPPGETAHEFATERSFEELGLEGLPFADIHGVFPHMHEAGQSLRLQHFRGSETQCMTDVPRWDFNWQLQYFFETPVSFLPGDRIRLSCVFNTVGRDEDTLPGWGTQNEMCLAGLHILLPPGVEIR